VAAQTLSFVFTERLPKAIEADVQSLSAVFAERPPKAIEVDVQRLSLVSPKDCQKQ